jgi:hypothetical protein
MLDSAPAAELGFGHLLVTSPFWSALRARRPGALERFAQGDVEPSRGLVLGRRRSVVPDTNDPPTTLADRPSWGRPDPSQGASWGLQGAQRSGSARRGPGCGYVREGAVVGPDVGARRLAGDDERAMQRPVRRFAAGNIGGSSATFSEARAAPISLISRGCLEDAAGLPAARGRCKRCPQRRYSQQPRAPSHVPGLLPTVAAHRDESGPKQHAAHLERSESGLRALGYLADLAATAASMSIVSSLACGLSQQAMNFTPDVLRRRQRPSRAGLSAVLRLRPRLARHTPSSFAHLSAPLRPHRLARIGLARCGTVRHRCSSERGSKVTRER